MKLLSINGTFFFTRFNNISSTKEFDGQDVVFVDKKYCPKTKIVRKTDVRLPRNQKLPIALFCLIRLVWTA
jgi:hypothetical protein